MLTEKNIMNDIEVLQVIAVGLAVSMFLLNTGRALKAIELCKECAVFLNNEAVTKELQLGKLFYFAIYNTMFNAYRLISDYTNAIKLGKELLFICRECGEAAKEKGLSLILAGIYKRQCRYREARECYERAINLMKDHATDRRELVFVYGEMGTVSYRLGEYDRAKGYLNKALAITVEFGDKAGEAAVSGNLGAVLKTLGEYKKAKEYIEKALAILIQIGDRPGEASAYRNLGTVFRSLGEIDKAKTYYEKALEITIEIGHREGEAAVYGDLGSMFKCVDEYDKAIESHKKALAINIEIGDRADEATCYGNLGVVFKSLGEYDKAKEYHEKALAIRVEIGDRARASADHVNLGILFQTLGEHDEAKEHMKEALAITIEVGDRAATAAIYGNLGSVFQSLGEHDKAKEYHKKALAIRTEIGDRRGEATDYGNLAAIFQSVGECEKAREYHEKARAIRVEIGDREGEAADYGNIGTLYHFLGDYVRAEEFVKKALSISQEIGDCHKELECYCNLTFINLSQGKMQEGFDYLFLSIQKCEDLRVFMRENDQFKISFSNKFPYHALSVLFCYSGNPSNALYVLELARARALAELMAIQYSVERQISVDPQSWIGIENVMKKESNCACLYISYFKQEMMLWILKTSRAIHFRTITVNENVIGVRLVSSLDNFLANSFRSLGFSPQLECEDRSFNSSKPEPELSQREELADLRLVEEDNIGNQDPEPSLPLLYKMLIAPVADLLEEPEIIIVPDRFLYRVPFAALTDEDGKFLSETFRIRFVPSLSTLKLIQDSPADYHSQTGALIVGDPVVGLVRYRGNVENPKPLPCARKEAEMIGELLGVQPLLGQHATKKAVLQKINSASLIHFAAHGNAERGEIVLSPVRHAGRIPEEEDYLLTMSDISQVQLRAKLVVLSCCHSGRGQIRAEGVVGIARAFLGSGARSVLVALWAIGDRATEQLMRHFYEHLSRGESASESLHEAMKWMRGNGFTEVSQWAPFMLIGDNVTFDFGK